MVILVLKREVKCRLLLLLVGFETLGEIEGIQEEERVGMERERDLGIFLILHSLSKI